MDDPAVEHPAEPSETDGLPAIVQEKLDALPPRPGCYVFRDKQGKPLYVGKAKSLRSRVRSYFQQGSSDVRAFIPLLLKSVADLETFVTSTEKEAAIIRYLFRAGQKAVTRDELLEEVWGYNSGVTTHTLETHVYRLRQKIEKDPSNAEILVTENGGYKIIP